MGPMTNCRGSRLLCKLAHHRKRVKTKKYGAAALVDDESSNVIVLILAVLAKHEAKVICVLGRKVKDQSESYENFEIQIYDL